MDKTTLRKVYIKKRISLAPFELNTLSFSISEQFKLLDYSSVRYLHLFYPIAGKNEFNSLLLANWLRKSHPEITLVLPKSNLSNYSMVHSIWTEETPLICNKWGITEPAEGQEISPEKIDMVVIPLLAFDIKGNRIGYGKGFYDRFLAECRKDVRKVGVSFFDPEAALTGLTAHDIALDSCITPDKIWKF